MCSIEINIASTSVMPFNSEHSQRKYFDSVDLKWLLIPIGQFLKRHLISIFWKEALHLEIAEMFVGIPARSFFKKIHEFF